MVLHAAQQLTEINVIFYYSDSFFVSVIDKTLMGTTLVGAINVVATYVALELMKSTGCVPLMLWSVRGMLISTVAVTLTLMGNIPNIVAVFGVMISAFFVDIAPAPIPWRIVGEMFDVSETKGRKGENGGRGNALVTVCGVLD